MPHRYAGLLFLLSLVLPYDSLAAGPAGEWPSAGKDPALVGLPPMAAPLTVRPGGNPDAVHVYGD